MINFIVLGAQKAATSSLQASLRCHPNVYMPKGESAFFEDPDFQREDWVSFKSSKSTATVCGIKRPDYFCSDEALQRIRHSLPCCKFIIVLREPVSRAVSSYCHLVRHAHLPAVNLNEGLVNCINDYEDGLDSRAASVVKYGLYGEYLTKWFDEYHKDRFLVLTQSEVRDNLSEAILKCLRHLDIDESLCAQISTASVESNVGLYDPLCLKVARIGSLLKTRLIDGTDRRVPRSIIPRLLGVLVGELSVGIARLKVQKREVLSDDVRLRLDKIYRKDQDKLKPLLALEVFNW